MILSSYKKERLSIMNKIDSFWHRFLKNTKRSEDIIYLDAFHFDLSEYWANRLLDLVLEGKKRATSSSLAYFKIKGLKIPMVGDFNIVTDWKGIPRCVIETSAVTIIPFKDMTYEICKREGEDECLETWKKGHISFFENDGKEVGYEFNDKMLLVFEDFEVIYKE